MFIFMKNWIDAFGMFCGSQVLQYRMSHYIMAWSVSIIGKRYNAQLFWLNRTLIHIWTLFSNSQDQDDIDFYENIYGIEGGVCSQKYAYP